MGHSRLCTSLKEALTAPSSIFSRVCRAQRLGGQKTPSPGAKSSTHASWCKEGNASWSKGQADQLLVIVEAQSKQL